MGTGMARTIDLEVYLNYNDEGGGPVSGDSTEMHCAQDAACVEATECGEDSAEVKVHIMSRKNFALSDASK
ncbi:unnamed protein product [Ectocarpus sp. CCAP 1310/34]|nr:unnamed protein product [Ectocarpus sp. CCAP 1310/34]